MTTACPDIDLSCDGHIHTRLCHHATGEMEEYVLAGIRRGLRKIVFLEHLEAGINYFETTWLTAKDFDYYCSEGERLRQKYGNGIEVGIGVELGYNPACNETLLSRVSERQWDRVGISCHFMQLPELPHHLNMLSRKKENLATAHRVGVDYIIDKYLDHLLEAVETMPGTVLCHLDAALRYIDRLNYIDNHLEQIDTLLVAVKRQNMALEINTSGIPIRGTPFPAREILHMAIEHRIPLVAGSDAHHPSHVGRHFAELPDYLTSAICP